MARRLNSPLEPAPAPYVEATAGKPAVGQATVIDVHRDVRPERAQIVEDRGAATRAALAA